MGVLEDLFGLDGRVAIVTGGAKGIGMFYSEASVRHHTRRIRSQSFQK